MSKVLIGLALLSAVLIASTVYVSQKSTPISTGFVENLDVSRIYRNWKLQFGIKYADSNEDNYRFQVFSENFEYAYNNQSGTLGLTKFMGLSRAEFAESYLTETQQAGAEPQAKDLPVSTSTHINWVDAGKVTSVKDQGSCGSCWTFSATGAVESALILGHVADKSINLSEQQLVSCDKSSGNGGCNGGDKSLAFKYIQQNGITTEFNYPYKAVNSSCKTDKTKNPIYKISGYKQVNASTQSLVEALAIAPIAISVDATNWGYYVGGVFSDCKSTSHNHAVLLVGIENGNWIVKNSWGTNWGENGYIRLKNGNTCGLANIPFYPIA